VSRWKISDSAPIYKLALIVVAFILNLSAVIFLCQAFGSLPATAQRVLVVLVVVLALIFFYRFVGNEELPQDEEEIRWWEIK